MRSKALIVSAVFAVIYSIYLIFHFSGTMSGDASDAEIVGGAIATLLVTPHIVMMVLASIFNILALALKKVGFALTTGILYSVAGVLLPLYLPFVIPMIVLSFVGYSKMKKFKSNNLNVES
ncbi:hypothetical protein GOQ29_12205 [Clostridium sp. D2Q-14]|uniref:hypothetical protein n=1 Tax=Anaeromonas gelatinilytica TaxID=2683194 RepID=UPI00193C3509|nr:hypothetical protein [Anaeromonas gelatinilytica]MBS4536380.1 hypothetical protein [Anaeromonas gelatinilytica]